MSAPEPRRIELPFSTRRGGLLVPPAQPAAPAAARPPLLVALHGQGESGERHRRWLGAAVPPRFASAWPDGFHAHEVRRPQRPIRLGYAWYLFTGDEAAFRDSLLESEAALWRFVDAAVAELGADPRVWLAGFSQGAYLAYCVAARAPGRVRGLVAQAGRLKWEFLGERLQALAGLPVLVQHGRSDAAIPPERAERSAQVLRDSGAAVELRLYDAAHVITPEMARDAREFLERHAPA